MAITLIDDQLQLAGGHELTWDGKDTESQYVPAKTYTIEITSSTGTQASMPVEVKNGNTS